MSLWSESRLIDILRNIDLSLVEAEYPEADCMEMEAAEGCPAQQEESSPVNWRKRIAVISGLAASSLAVAGMAVLLCRKYGRRALYSQGVS